MAQLFIVLTPPRFWKISLSAALTRLLALSLDEYIHCEYNLHGLWDGLDAPLVSDAGDSRVSGSCHFERD